MGIFADIQKFIEEHHDCGDLARHALPPTLDGYRVMLACSCGETFDRWVTPEAARHDLIYSNLLVVPN